MSYIVIWIDLEGRLRTKSYVYRGACESYAVKLSVRGLALNNDIRIYSCDGHRVVLRQRCRKEVRW